MLLEMLCCIFLLLWLFYWYLTKNYDHWDKKGVPNKKAEFPFGSLKDVILTRKFVGKGHDDIYKQFLNERFYGIIDFREPALVLRDPELIKKVMVKDFHHFVDRPGFLGNPKEYIQLHLLNLVGQEWKDMRAKLTPTFTSGKMKLMFVLMEKCCEQLKEQLEIESKGGKAVDAKDLLARFTMEIIASCAFGLDTNSISEKNADFYQRLGGVTKTSKLRYIRRIILMVFPFLMKTFRINTVRPELTDFLTNLVKDSIVYREKNNIKRNDFLDLLINIPQSKSDCEENERTSSKPKTTTSEGITVEQMTAQAFVFFIAGFETASSLMSFCLYELSCHQNVQDQLFQVIRDAVDKNGGKISYQILQEIPLLDQVINETLRLYGSAHVLRRRCTQTYRVNDSDLVIMKGSKVIIPLFSLHHDPQYYPEPYEFRPERFSPEECKRRHPYVFMPFGEGPRNCIGMRFGLLQAKTGLATILLNFRVELSPAQEVPIQIHTRTLVLMPANPVWLHFYKRTPL